MAESTRAERKLQVVMKRLKFLDGYTGKNDVHHGVRLAVSMIRGDLRSAAQLLSREARK
jgi:hypothetical protein